jgi:2-oxoglutarate ferredoxin oxidoreductase subunit beta
MAGSASKVKTNHIGLPLTDYRGRTSTLCKGCGHDVISNTIIQAYYEMGVEPQRVAKLSGIGCSSKTPAYFLGKAWGFNAVHGRMPSVATGALLANRNLRGIGVSGDGDTASIGIGQFVHLVRRNLPLIYIVENNGVYGLTKGQFSATADKGSRLKDGTPQDLTAIDICTLAVELGATYVARSFSADRRQLLELLKGAIAHDGLAVLDVMSPCVTFNNHEGSTKSYDWGREHQGPINEIGFVPAWEHPEVEPGADEAIRVPMPHGGTVAVRRIGAGHDPRDKDAALALLAKGRLGEEYLTGLFYLSPDEPSFYETLHLGDTPLGTLPEARVRPPRSALDEINESFR